MLAWPSPRQCPWLSAGFPSTLVWGQRRSTAMLSNGDVFETGSTFWIFRSMVVSDSTKLGPPDEGVLGSSYPPFIKLANRLKRVARTRGKNANLSSDARIFSSRTVTWSLTSMNFSTK